MPAEPSGELDYLSVDDLLEIAAGVVDDLRVRDAGLLAAAAARPRTTVFGAHAYEGLSAKAAALTHSLARNHPLVDGNKRLAWSAARVFCLLNDRDLDFAVDEAEAMIVGAAAGELDVDALTRLIAPRLRALGA